MNIKSILVLGGAFAIACTFVLTYAYVLDPVESLEPSSDPFHAPPPSEGYRPVRLLKPIKPITEFPVKSVKEAADKINPSELVIAVTVGKESRAYPVNMLTGPFREILNDTLGGIAIAATW